MALNKNRVTKTGGKNSRAPLGEVWDKQSAPDQHDERKNTNSGDSGKEPGGRWSKAYYDTPAKIVGRTNIRDV